MSKGDRVVVVIHPGSLGDVLLAVPALKGLRFRYPQHTVVLVASEGIGRLLQAYEIVDRVLPTEGAALTALLAADLGVPPLWDTLLATCDLFVGWFRDDGALANLCAHYGIGSVVIESPDSRNEMHQRDRFLASLQESLEPGPSPILDPLDRVRLRSGGLNRWQVILPSLEGRLILCHPGSGSLHKCVTAAVFHELIEGCRLAGYRPVIVAGPADERMVQALEPSIREGTVIAKPPDLVGLAELLSLADGCVGHDSGVSHLAALLGVPTVAMFGPTDPRRWAPQGNHVRVVSGESCRCQGWMAVQACAEKSCLPRSAKPVLAALNELLS